MIHLDRSHHHDLDQSQKQNLILSRDHDAPHFDWDDLANPADNLPFFHDALHAQHPLAHLQPDTTISPALHDDKSSSLSPAPDSGTPPTHQNTASLPAPHPPDKQEPDLAGTLTPLTELSPAPDDAPEDNKDPADDPKDASLPNPQDDPRRAPPTVRVNGVTSPPASSSSSPSGRLPTADVLASRINGAHPTGASSHSRASSGEFLVPSGLAVPAAGHDNPKVGRILDINAELFNICSEILQHGVHFSDSRFQQYAARLQVNLAWLAAAADQRHNNPSVTLPAMDPPMAIDFISMDRIHQLYADISTMFAKDFARRQALNTTHQGSPIAPSVVPNGALKRARPDDLADLASKRRDMGEKKPHVTPTPPPVTSLPGASHPNPPTTFPPPQPNIAMSTAPAMPQSPRVSSPAMPPPTMTQSLPFATETSIAATTRARARELQLQQVREQQQLRQAAQMQQMQAARQVSPPSAPQPVTQGASAGGQSNAAFGPQAQQIHSILRDPNHPLMQFIIQQMPQFQSLPTQTKFQMVQNAVSQRQQQQQQQQQQLQNPQVTPPQRNPQMAGMGLNASVSTMSNGTLSAGVQSPVSPLVQQSPVMPQQPQQLMNQPAQNGMFAFGQGHTNPVMDPRMASMAAGMPNNMNINQQRQMMLMQQQMRNAGGNVNAVPNMVNSQHAFAMAQRMAQAGPSQAGTSVGGSPMSGTAGDQFPALRSNSTIPGIARSARSPSDGLHSPMTPRAPSRLSQQPQLQNDYSQAMMQHSHAAMAQNSGTFNPQVQNLNWPQNGQQPMQQQMGMVAGQMNGYSMGSPNGAGMGGGFFGSTPTPPSINWQQQSITGSYPYGQTMGQQPQSDQARLSHMAGMSIPQNMSAMADGSGVSGDYDIFNYNGS